MQNIERICSQEIAAYLAHATLRRGYVVFGSHVRGILFGLMSKGTLTGDSGVSCVSNAPAGIRRLRFAGSNMKERTCLQEIAAYPAFATLRRGYVVFGSHARVIFVILQVTDMPAGDSGVSCLATLRRGYVVLGSHVQNDRGGMLTGDSGVSCLCNAPAGIRRLRFACPRAQPFPEYFTADLNRGLDIHTFLPQSWTCAGLC